MRLSKKTFTFHREKNIEITRKLFSIIFKLYFFFSFNESNIKCVQKSLYRTIFVLKFRTILSKMLVTSFSF